MTRSAKVGPALAIAAVAAAAGLAVASAAGVEFSFERAHGTYENVVVEALPITSGALDVQLSSPANSVTLEAGTLSLEPVDKGLHRALLDVKFSGQGQLVTTVNLGAFPARFEDEVRFPRQQRSISGSVSIEAVEDGYRVVAQQLPETVEIEIESALAGNLVGFCRRMSLFVAGTAGCDNLESQLSHPRLPLPKPGSVFLVRGSDLTEAERERLNVYLEDSKLSTALTP